jgi:hypothetical protein
VLERGNKDPFLIIYILYEDEKMNYQLMISQLFQVRHTEPDKVEDFFTFAVLGLIFFFVIIGLLNYSILKKNTKRLEKRLLDFKGYKVVRLGRYLQGSNTPASEFITCVILDDELLLLLTDGTEFGRIKKDSINGVYEGNRSQIIEHIRVDGLTDEKITEDSNLSKYWSNYYVLIDWNNLNGEIKNTIFEFKGKSDSEAKSVAYQLRKYSDLLHEGEEIIEIDKGLGQKQKVSRNLNPKAIFRLGTILIICSVLFPWFTEESITHYGIETFVGIFSLVIGTVLLILSFIKKPKPGKRYSITGGIIGVFQAIIALAFFYILGWGHANYPEQNGSIDYGLYWLFISTSFVIVGGFMKIPLVPVLPGLTEPTNPKK